MWEIAKSLPRAVQAAFVVIAVVAVVAIGIGISQDSEHDTDLAAWDQERGSLTERVAGLEADKQGLEATVAEQKAKIAGLEGDKAALLKVHADLAALEAEAAASKGKLAGLNHEVVARESELKVIGSRLAVNQASLMQAIKRRDQAAQDFAEMKVSHARLGKVRDDVRTTETELAMLGQRLAVGHQSLQKVLARVREAEENAAVLQTQRAVLKQLGVELAAKEDQTKALARRLANSQVALTGALSRLRTAEEANRTLTIQNNWLAQVVAETEAKERQLKVISQRLATSHASLERALTERDRVIGETRTLRAKLTGVARGLEPLQRQIANWEVEVQKLKDLVGDAHGELGEALVF